MTYLKKGLALKFWVVLAWILTLNSIVLACDVNNDFARPTCKETELQYGMCFNSNMAEAVDIVKSPSYKDNFNSIIRQAEEHLDSIEPASTKVVLTDLDETLVDNASYYERYKSFSPSTWQIWLKEQVLTEGPYFSESLELIKEAKKKGFSVMFITGRPVAQTDDTLKQLGSISWDGMFFRPQGKSVSSKEYKTKARDMLRQLGYEIVLNLGDQPSDFDLPIKSEEGEFLLPNIMYFSP